jgi:macrolide-specific efflux system membrane fusion protein
MKLYKTITLVAAIGLVGALAASCGAKNTASTTTQTQNSTVKRGTISVEITATGNLAYSDVQKLSFAANGTVSEVNVDVGDSITQDQVLAALDADDWQDQLIVLQKALTNAQRQIPTQQLNLQQAQINLISAQDSLNSIQDIKDAQDALAAAQNQQKIDEGMLKEAMLTGGGTGSTAVNFWNLTIAADKQKVADAQKTLNDVSSGTSASVASNANTQIALKQLAILQAQQKIVDTQNALDDANQAVKDAQKALDDAKATSTEIKSPFDGVVTVVSITPGAAIKKGAAAITVADTSKFQTDILVNEMDIPNVTVGTQATVQIEAMSGVTLSARVTTIAPISTNQSGVVTYKVTADLTSLAALQTTTATAAADPAQLAAAQQRLNDAIAKAVATGQITQAQADAFKQRWSQIAANLTQDQLDQLIKAAGQRTGTAAVGQGLGAGALAQGGAGAAGANAGLGAGHVQQRQASGQLAGQSTANATNAVQLRQGLSATVNLIIQQRQNVLVVPNQAVKTQGSTSYVEVLNNGATEQRQVTVGLKDWQNTEIVSGLNEGDTVVIVTSTSSSSSRTTTTTSSQGIRIPGVGSGSGLLR